MRRRPAAVLLTDRCRFAPAGVTLTGSEPFGDQRDHFLLLFLRQLPLLYGFRPGTGSSPGQQRDSKNQRVEDERGGAADSGCAPSLPRSHYIKL